MQPSSATLSGIFADSLLEARRTAGLTQKQASDALKAQGLSVSERSIVGYEAGKNTPTDTKQLSILSVLRNLAAQGGGSGDQASDEDAPPRYLEPSDDHPPAIDTSRLGLVGARIIHEVHDGDGPVALFELRAWMRREPTRSRMATRVEPLG